MRKKARNHKPRPTLPCRGGTCLGAAVNLSASGPSPRFCAVLSLIALGTGLLILSLLLWKGQWLPSWGLNAHAYETLVVGLGVSASTFLFGALRWCQSRPSGRRDGGVLHLAGSLVGGALVTWAAFYLVPNP
jgi:hypothetical protein